MELCGSTVQMLRGRGEETKGAGRGGSGKDRVCAFPLQGFSEEPACL
jgi:hypothetical protein